MKATGSVNGAVVNLTIGALGVAVLTIPSAFAGVGAVTATLLLFLVASMTVASIEYLGMCMDELQCYGYEEITARLTANVSTAFSCSAVNAARLMLFLFNFGDCVGYLLVIGQICPELLGRPIVAAIDSRSEPRLVEALLSPTCWMVMYWVCLLLPLSFVCRVTMLERGSAVSVLVVLYVAVAVVYRYYVPLAHSEGDAHGAVHSGALVRRVATTSWTKGLMSLPLVMFAFDCQALVFQLYASLGDATAQSLTIVARRSMLIVCGVLLAVGLFGYLTFGQSTPDNILRGYDARSDVLFGVGFALFLIPVTLAYALVIFPLRDVVMGGGDRGSRCLTEPLLCKAAEMPLTLDAANCERHLVDVVPSYGTCDRREVSAGASSAAAALLPTPLLSESTRSVRFCLVSFGLSLAILATATVAPGLDVVFGLLGGLCSSSLCFVYPPLYRIQLHRLGIKPFSCIWQKIVAHGMVTIGVFGAVAGVCAGVAEIGLL